MTRRAPGRGLAAPRPARPRRRLATRDPADASRRPATRDPADASRRPATRDRADAAGSPRRAPRDPAAASPPRAPRDPAAASPRPAPRDPAAPRPLRLFVALDLPDDVRDLLAALGQAADHRVWRPVARDALHVTLAFLGSRPPGDVELIAPIVAAERDAPRLALAAVLLLPPRRARVLTVALDDATGALAALQARVSSALESAGVYTPEARPFRPHVTIARLRPRTRPPRDAPLHLDRREFSATAVTLYASRLHPGGARYDPLARARLG
jgi:2'-5' RNA ligase